MNDRSTDDPASGSLVAEEAAPLARGLGTVLTSVREQMGADTATILMVDHDRTGLEPMATVGLEPTLRGARRVPMGEGFAGRIAKTRRPLVLTEVSSDNVVNPVLLRSDIRVLLGAPIIEGNELFGVLHVGYRSVHETTRDELLLLARLADEVGALLRERVAGENESAAFTLQRSLLPETPAVPEGIEVAARYVAAEGEVGGDWYDVLELPGDRLGLVVGDVGGRGLEAAIVMGRLRSALRAYALVYDDPAQVLTHLDHKICHFEPGAFASVLFGLAEKPYDEWRFSSAGQYAPLVGGPGLRTQQTAVASELLLGLEPDAARSSTTVSVSPDGFLCLFTNGLVERRPTPHDGAHADIAAANLQLVAAALTAGGDPAASCVRVLSEVMGDQLPEDDLVVLIARRSDTRD